MCSEILTDMANGLYGAKVNEEEWEFSRIGKVRMFAERMVLRSGKIQWDFLLKVQAEWRDGLWIETFRIDWRNLTGGEIVYRLQGDREIIGILRPEVT